MSSSRYALVTYVRNPVGEFVAQLRRELHPTIDHMPAHLTIMKTETDALAESACALARERWAQFAGRRQVDVEELVFVRENGNCWQDLAPVPLGRGQLSSKT